MMSARLRIAVVTAATVFTMAVTASLGFWQLDRARQKLDLQDQINQRANLPAWQTGDLLQASDPMAGLHRPAQLRGEWVADASVFLDNRQMATRNGFILVTPLRLTGSQRAVLVQRGWVPRDFTDRSRVPTIDTPSGEVQVEGRLAPPPGKLYQLGEAGTGAIRQNIDLNAFAQETGLDLLVVSVQQAGDSPEGLLREWPRAAVGVDKHHGYAFQWFGLCALAGLLYVWFQFISPRRKRISHGTDAR
ncbi:SURF1 family protein [Hydrogenophaga sp.]|jgi:surfeit locus 1 family protein|uniref:SURF1 family protein n=1 Tax=Hydrogenophaga sp. TaxID=1904254 RepID=UPI00273085C3|nr:SURF1 family protein [Hydrogenophaga sp.]MDP1686501.1 SURF1 family protein [Hydrogenophaga sp.]